MMEQPAECKAEDIQAPSGDDDVNGMSVISIESASPESVRSELNSSLDEVDDFMVDVDNVDADGEEVASSENGTEDRQSPVLDVVQEETSALSENFCVTEMDSKEVTDDDNQCDSSLCETTTPSPENAKENSVSAKDVPSFSVAGGSDKCGDGMELTSENTTTLELGIIL